MLAHMGVTPTLFGFYVMIVPTTFMVASYITGILGKWVPLDRLIAVGCAIAIVGGLIQFGFAVSGASTPITILTAILISNFGTGLAFANCYGQSLSAVSPSVAGAGSALTGFVHMGWAFLISFGLASIDDINVVDLGISQTATTLASTTAFIFLVWFVRPQRNA